MPALDAQMLADFAAPLTAGKPLDEWPAIVPFRDPDGALYQVTIEKVPRGLRIVVRRSSAKAPQPAARGARRCPRPKSSAWWASPRRGAAAGRRSRPRAARRRDAPDGRERLGRSLAPLVAIARDARASDVIVSTGQTPRMRVEGRIEPLDMPVDDGELAACVAALGAKHRCRCQPRDRRHARARQRVRSPRRRRRRRAADPRPRAEPRRARAARRARRRSSITATASSSCAARPARASRPRSPR